jgi:L-ascorbate metabolism protein UlaG (beta-lactamase superfamily)
MDIQFYGANCVRITNKKASLVFDDNLVRNGLKSVTQKDDIAFFSELGHEVSTGRFVIDSPGEYEISEVSVRGIAAQRHIDSEGKVATLFSIKSGDLSVGILGHIDGKLSDEQLEQIGIVDVLILPVGGNGFTLDAVAAVKLVKDIEPKIVIPTHYADDKVTYEVPQAELSVFLHEIGASDVEPVPIFKLKKADLTDKTTVVVLERTTK